MSLYEELLYKTGDAVKKGRKVALRAGKEIALAAENARLNAEISKQYSKLGELYYRKHGLSPEAELVAVCDRITELKAMIGENEETVTKMKIDGVIDEVVVDPED